MDHFINNLPQSDEAPLAVPQDGINNELPLDSMDIQGEGAPEGVQPRIKYWGSQDLEIDDQGVMFDLTAEPDTLRAIVRQVKRDGYFKMPQGSVKRVDETIWVGQVKIEVSSPEVAADMEAEGSRFRWPPLYENNPPVQAMKKVSDAPTRSKTPMETNDESPLLPPGA